MLRVSIRACCPILSVALLGFGAAAMVAADARPPVAALGPAVAEPAEFRAIYLTYWSAVTASRVDAVLELAREGLINAVVIDVKDVTGTVAFDTRVAMASEIGAKRVIIRDLKGLLDRFHGAGLYAMARLVVFSDPKLAEARPGWAVHSAAKVKAGGDLAAAPPRGGRNRLKPALWRDRRNLAWIDPSATGAWEYNLAIALDALSRGFDEINFDYIRFPSDGALADMSFPVWDERVPRRRVIRAFFSHLRREMGAAVISADLFGLSTVNRDDLGIGQVIEDAMEHFDYVCPMVYPSHYAAGFIGKQKPVEFPYEVVYHSLKTAQQRLNCLAAADPAARRTAKLRPWLQDFNLGAKYTPEMVAAQVQATRDSLGEAYRGFVLWNPRNAYEREALEMIAR